MRAKTRRLRYVLGSAAGILLILLMETLGFFNGMDYALYDLYFRFRREQIPPKDILIVAIDEKTLSALGRWPIRRSYYIDLLEKLMPARAVGIDLILSEPSEDDPDLGRAIERHGKVVLPVYIDQRHGWNFPARPLGSATVGHIHLEPDIDGVVRNAYQRMAYRGCTFPSFSLALFHRLNPDRPPKRPPTPMEKEVPHIGKIFQWDSIMINYYGPRGRFQTVSLSEVIEGKWPNSFFRDRTVLVGVTSAGLEEAALTPLMQERTHMPGVEVHAHILANLTEGSSIKGLSRGLRWVFLLVFSGLGYFLFTRTGPSRAALGWFSGLAGIILVSFLLFAEVRLWAPPSSFLFSLTLVFLVAYIYRLDHMGVLLREAKEDWEESFNTIEDAIVIHDRNGRVVQNNRVARQSLGEPLLQLLEERCRSLGEKGTASGSVTGQPSPGEGWRDRATREEVYVPDMDRHVEITSIPRWGKENRFEGMVQVVRDITERVKSRDLQESLRSQLVMAQKMEAIGTLAGGIAHDFNNILSAILGYTELAALDLPAGSRVKNQLDQVLKGGTRARELVNQILTFSRQTEGEQRPLEIVSLIKEVLKLLRPALPSTIEIRTDLRSDGVIMGDLTQLHQVLMNLCTNAYHAMRKEGGVLNIVVDRVTLETENGNPNLPPGEYVRLEVTDTGCGIPGDLLERIFEPYFTTKQKGEGTGLGLALVRSIVKGHGGAISVESQPGKGSVFSVFLPVIHEKILEKKEDLAPLPTGKERILFVDDEEALVLLGKEMLKFLGYDTVALSNSVEALEYFRKAPEALDLVITDLTMPHLTGLELSKAILRIRPRMPIILCTGFSDSISKSEAEKLGIRAFIMKPVVMADMARTIREVLEERS